MKTLTLWTFILILFTACSNDNDFPANGTDSNAGVNSSMLRKTGQYPENIANAYDSAGQLQNEICEAYLLQNNSQGTTAWTISKIEAIANLNTEFLALRPVTYLSPTAGGIDSILNNQVTLSNVISNSSMSIKGKLSLTGFTTTLMSYRDQQTDYDSIYQLIVGYESGILSDSGYTANDKRIILTTTSISRYAFYFASKRKKRKPKDEDWGISWGHIVAAIDGSEESTASAIVKSSVCNILTNN